MISIKEQKELCLLIFLHSRQVMEGECWSKNISKMRCLGLLDLNEVVVILVSFLSIWLMIVFALMNSLEHLFFWNKKMFDFQWQMQIIYIILNWIEVK